MVTFQFRPLTKRVGGGGRGDGAGGGGQGGGGGGGGGEEGEGGGGELHCCGWRRSERMDVVGLGCWMGWWGAGRGE